MSLMKESLILIVIGLADLLVTLHLVTYKDVAEGNPLMAYYLQLGVGAFVIVKLMLLVFPIFIAEFSKRYKPQFVKWMLRGAIAMYIGSYLIAFVLVNIKPMLNDRHSAPADKTVQMRMADRTR